MKVIALKYGPYMTRVMATLSGIIALCLFLYGIFLLEAVAHTASRTQTEHSIAANTSELSGLEATYLARTQEITLDRAYGMGLVQPTQIATVYTGAQDGLSLLSE